MCELPKFTLQERNDIACIHKIASKFGNGYLRWYGNGIATAKCDIYLVTYVKPRH